jgi:hypothetical protein
MGTPKSHMPFVLRTACAEPHEEAEKVLRAASSSCPRAIPRFRFLREHGCVLSIQPWVPDSNDLRACVGVQLGQHGTVSGAA